MILRKIMMWFACLWCSLSLQSIADAKVINEPILPYTDVVIDAGHGGIDGGAVHKELLEKDLNLAMAEKLYTALSERHLNVVLNRKGDYALSEENHWLQIRSRHKRDLAQRTQLANELQPLLLVSLHMNTARNSAKSGPLVFHQQSDSSHVAAVFLQEALNRYYGVVRQPMFGKTYYLLNHSTCPTVIVELGFLTNAADRARLTDPKQQLKLARVMASAIEQYLMLPQTEKGTGE